MTQTIYYFIDIPNHQFYFYDNLKDAKIKEKELGYHEDPNFGQLPNIFMETKSLTRYYGTVWLVYYFHDTTVAFNIYSTYREAKTYLDRNPKAQLKKFELKPYESPKQEPLKPTNGTRVSLI